MKTIIVTTGDLDGIGLEVFSKAILVSPIYLKLAVIFFLSEEQEKSSWFEAMRSVCQPVRELRTLSAPGLFYVKSTLNPVDWVFISAQFCMRHPHEVLLVTGPLDKNSIVKNYPMFLGHTEILAHLSQVEASNVLMFFIGKFFNVLCLTGHLPISEVERCLSEAIIIKKLNSFRAWQKKFGLEPVTGKTVVLGLNPHCSDKGLIGDFELHHLNPALEKLDFISAKKPLVPDATFINFDKGLSFKTAVALYHDQGLIPFKMAHGFSGVHLSAGLPFLRLSVDHGTAKDIFDKNLADATSMKDCLNLAYRLAIK